MRFGGFWLPPSRVGLENAHRVRCPVVPAFKEGARVKVYTPSRSHGRLRSRPCIIDRLIYRHSDQF